LGACQVNATAGFAGWRINKTGPEENRVFVGGWTKKSDAGVEGGWELTAGENHGGGEVKSLKYSKEHRPSGGWLKKRWETIKKNTLGEAWNKLEKKIN